MLRHVEDVFPVVREIVTDHGVLQTIRQAFICITGERTRHVQVFRRGMAGVAVQFHMSARAHAFVRVLYTVFGYDALITCE